MLEGETGFELFQTFYRGDEIRNNKKERTVCSFFICKIITWQDFADEFQLLDNSGNMHEIYELLDDTNSRSNISTNELSSPL